MSNSILNIIITNFETQSSRQVRSSSDFETSQATDSASDVEIERETQISLRSCDREKKAVLLCSVIIMTLD